MYKHLFSLLCVVAVGATASFAQRADNYVPTNDRNVKLTETNLPIAFINVKGKTIQRNERITARMKIIDNKDGKNYGDTIAHPNQKADYDGYISLKYRGNSSFNSSDKKPYGFKTLSQTLEEGGKKQKVKLLGMGKDNDWAFLAPFSDKSMIRDVLTFELGRPYFGYTPHSRFVEIVLDGTYYGVYILTERPGKGKSRLNLNDPGSDNGDLTGDYHVEIDRDDETIFYTSPYRPLGWDGQPNYSKKITYQYDDPDGDDLLEMPAANREAIDKAINDMEKSFTLDNYTDPAVGYRKYINTTSFIDYLLSTEFSFNIDGYRLSTHLYKYSDTRAANEGLDNRWQATLWDFNIAYGNANYNYGEHTDLWQYDFNSRSGDDQQVPFWWKKLLEDPSFVKEMQARWKEYRLGAYSDANIEATINRLTGELTSGGAIDRNEQAWKMFGRAVWPNYYVGNSYADEINYLKQWISKRLTFLDSKLLVREADASTEPLTLSADACNADVVVEAMPSTSHFTSPIDSWRTFYSQDVRSTGGLPADGKLVSASKVAYQLGHYAKNNVVAMTSNDQHRINFAQPVAANTVYLLATSTAGASTLGVVLNYEDGTSSEESIVSVRDWSVPDLQGDEAYTGLGFISIENEELSDRFRYCLFENAIAANPIKKLTGLTLTHKSGGNAYVFAVSRGVPQGTTGVANISDNQPRTVTAYFTADGIKTATPVKGLNIVRYSDGSSKKIVVK